VASVTLLALAACATPLAHRSAEAAHGSAGRPSAPVEGRVLAVGAGTGLAFSSDGKRAFIAGLSPLREVELATGQIRNVPITYDGTPESDNCRYDLFRYCQIYTKAIALSVDGRAAYVIIANAMENYSDAVSRIDLDSGHISWWTPVPGPRRLTVSPGGEQVWILGDTPMAVDAKTGARIGESFLEDSENPPTQLAVSPDGRRAYSSREHPATLELYDTRTGARASRAAPGSPRDVHVDHLNEVWALYDDGLLAFDGATLQTRKAMRYCRDLEAGQFALSNDGRHVAIRLDEEQLVLVASRDSGLLTHAFRTGHGGPFVVAFTPDSRHVVTLDGRMGGGMSIFDLGIQMNIERYVSEAGELFCRPAQGSP